MRQRRAWAAAVVAMVYISFSAVAYGQTTSPPSDQARAQASERFRRGVELYQEGAYRAALVEFERAYGIAPDYRLLYNIGQVKLQLQDYLGATQSYEQYLAEGGADIPAARRDDVEEAFATLRQRVGRISISTNRDGAELFIDDTKVGVSPMGNTVPVNLGRHRVYGRAEDGATAAQVIDIAGGDVIEVQLELKAPELKSMVAGEKRQPLSSMKVAAIVSWAGAGAALIGAGVAGFLAQGKVDDRNKLLESPLPDAKKAKSLEDSANTLALTTDVLAGVALVGAGAGVALWLMAKPENDKKDSEAAEARTVHFGVGLGSITAFGRF